MAHPLRVLLVDDDDVTLEELGECLAGAGLACITAPSGSEARSKIDAHDDIGVLVTDLNMPGEDGLSLMRYCNRSRGAGTQMKVILITGGASLGSAMEAVREGAFDYVTKPTEPARLIETVHRACKAVAAERANAAMAGMLAGIEAQRADLARQLDVAVQRLERGGARDEFLTMMSHELRTPLNPIIGFAEFLRDHADGLSTETIKDYAGDVLTAGQRLLRLVERMLQLAALRRGDLKPDRDSVRAADVLDTAARQLKARGDDVGRVTWPSGAATQLPLDADTRMLADTLTELVSNALLFAPDGGPVAVTVGHGSDPAGTGSIEFHIADRGPGMTCEQIERAMRPFEQLDMSMARRIEGVGIGLPLAHHIVAAHGGTLTLARRSEGGMMVTVRLPAAA